MVPSISSSAAAPEHPTSSEKHTSFENSVAYQLLVEKTKNAQLESAFDKLKSQYAELQVELEKLKLENGNLVTLTNAVAMAEELLAMA
ncbi:expressed unknown protein [Seminavis robusta]|uniref:Uncharacterized protein n=1 Tax=Seminavis robusta TaxID=568900 RepID=A0A9N8DIM5_9STRA|nr:expressed unknown protein [Seminavis robusta]|eukprot:Sro82_g044130.1 n/a (88) ;mRNA; r:124607-124870